MVVVAQLIIIMQAVVPAAMADLVAAALAADLVAAPLVETDTTPEELHQLTPKGKMAGLVPVVVVVVVPATQIEKEEPVEAELL